MSLLLSFSASDSVCLSHAAAAAAYTRTRIVSPFARLLSRETFISGDVLRDDCSRRRADQANNYSSLTRLEQPQVRVEAQFSAASADTCRVFIDFNLSLAPHARIIVLRCIRLLALKLFFSRFIRRLRRFSGMEFLVLDDDD